MQAEIAQLIQSYFLLNFEITEDLYDIMLTSKPFSLNGVSLVYLFFEIQRKYNITIPANKLDNYGFSSISKIASIVKSLV